MSDDKHIHITIPAGLAAEVNARRMAVSGQENERVSLSRYLRHLIRAGLRAEAPSNVAGSASPR